MEKSIVHLVASRRFTGGAAVALSWHHALGSMGKKSYFFYEGGHNLEEKLSDDPFAFPIRKGLIRKSLEALVPPPFWILAHLSSDHFWGLVRFPRSTIPVFHRPRGWRKVFSFLLHIYPNILKAYGTQPYEDFVPPALVPSAMEPPPLAQRPYTLGTIGKLTSDRHHRWVLDVFLRLLDHHPKATLVILGKGPERKILESIIQAHGLKEKVTFAGYREGEELNRWYQKIQILLWPHPGSQFAHRALCEAALQGCVMAAPPMPFVEAWIRPEKTGLILSPLPSQAAEKLAQLLHHPSSLQGMAEEGRSFVTKMTDPTRVATYIEKTLSVIDTQKASHIRSTKS